MNFLQSVFLDYFTIGSVIPVLFLYICGAAFLQVKDKSRATRMLALGLIVYGTFIAGYVVASTFYHPAAAFHRWDTVGFVLPAIAYLMQIFFEFPEPKATRVAKITMRLMLLVGFGLAIWFMVHTLEVGYVYHFEGHYYDFDADEASYVISLSIFLYVLIMIGVGLWRIFNEKGRDRLALVGGELLGARGPRRRPCCGHATILPLFRSG